MPAGDADEHVLGLEALKADWRRRQEALSQQVVSTDSFSWCLDEGQQNPLALVGGVDISFWPGDGDREPAVAALVVLSYPELQVVYEDFEPLDLSIPYMAGFLGFRECPAFLRLLQRVSTTVHNPQVVFVDGNGILHHRQCGSASHLGIVSGYPTIGVAKNLLHVEGLDERGVRREVKRRIDAHDSSTSPNEMNVPLIGDSGRVWGAAMYGHGEGVSQPVYVSVGHRVSLESGLDLARRCSRHRIPEPIRQADLRSRKYTRSHAPPT